MTWENCPCKKRNCPRHGDCAACRAHHQGSRRRRPCEKAARSLWGRERE